MRINRIKHKIIQRSFFIILALILVINARAQSNWEFGVRAGNDFSLEATIPFRAPRLHPALYFDRYLSTGLYFDWMFALAGGPTGLKFYPGVGPELFFHGPLDISVAGDFGMEYSFDFPLTIGLDWRPHFMITDHMNFNPNRWGVFARFRIGEGIRFVKTD